MFKFLPGHKTLILSLPKHWKKEKKQKKNKSTEVQCASAENLHVLKVALIQKITNYSKKNNFEIECAISDIVELKFDQTQYKCQIRCPFCDDTVSCMYTSYWIISNLVRHIKKRHTVIEEVAFIEETHTENVRSDPIVRLAPERHQELMNYLNESENESEDE